MSDSSADMGCYNDDESDDEDFPDVEVAGEELAAALVGLYLAGTLTAKSLCNLAW